MRKIRPEYFDIIPISPFLVGKRYQKSLDLYTQFLLYTRNVTSNMNISNFDKIKKLSEIEEVFFDEKNYTGKKLEFIVKLKNNFVKELLAPSLVKDIITAAKSESAGAEYKTWGQLVNYCSSSFGTIARFMLALYDESPTTYIPATSLFAAFQMLHLLRKIKQNLNNLGKVHIPTEILKEYKVEIREFNNMTSSKQVKKVFDNVLKEIKKMLKDAEILPSIIKNRSLRMQFCIILSAANILFRKVKKKDILAKKVKLSKFDFYNSYMTGVIEGFFTSYRDVNTKRLKK